MIIRLLAWNDFDLSQKFVLKSDFIHMVFVCYFHDRIKVQNP